MFNRRQLCTKLTYTAPEIQTSIEPSIIAWAAILTKIHQLILFDGTGFGIFVAYAKRR